MTRFPRACLKAGLSLVLAFPALSASQLLFGIAPSAPASGRSVLGAVSGDWQPALVPFAAALRNWAEAAAASWTPEIRRLSSLRPSAFPAVAPAGMMLPGRGWLILPPPDSFKTN